MINLAEMTHRLYPRAERPAPPPEAWAARPPQRRDPRPRRKGFTELWAACQGAVDEVRRAELDEACARLSLSLIHADVERCEGLGAPVPPGLGQALTDAVAQMHAATHTLTERRRALLTARATLCGGETRG